MGYYASGDTRKMTQTSEDDEGYENHENQSSSTAISIVALNQPAVRDKQYPETTSPPPIPPISDDTDRPFWAEDELSSAESRQQLNKKQKCRRSSSYRNRIAVGQRSRPLLFQSSSSSLDSISERISPGVSEQGRLASRFTVGRPGHSKTKKSNNSRKKGRSHLNTDRINCTECKRFNKRETRNRCPFLSNKTSRHQ